MVEHFSSIGARIRQAGGLHFLFIPLGGLVVYVFLFNATKPSALLLAGPLEKITALFTLIFFAFACTALLTFVLGAGQASKNATLRILSDRAGLVVFATLATLLAIVMIENFTYTVFRIGIRNTESLVAKALVLAMSAGIFCFFLRISGSIRKTVSESRLRIANAMIAVASIFAIVNVSGNMNALASLDAKYSKRYNIVILSSDGINANRMSLYGYKRQTTPFLDTVKDEFLIARSAYASNGHTTGSIVSLLTGMLPTRSKVVFPPDSLSGENAYRSLPRLLRKQGYYTNNIAVPHYSDASEQNMLEAFVYNNNRSMVSSSFPIKFNYKTTNWLFDRLLSDTTALVRDVLWLEEMPNPYAQVDGKERGKRHGLNDMQRLQGLLSDLNRTDKPFFINSHFLGTHGPYFNPGVIRFSLGSKDQDKVWSNDHYDDAILTFDAYVKRVYKRLESKGLLDKTILVITSDHAASHEPRKKIPMMIRFPDKDFAGTVINSNTQTVDVAPTIIDYLGGSKPAWMDGQSLISGPLPVDRKIFSASVTKIFFAPSIGVLTRPSGRYGSMHYFYMMHCDMTYKLDLKTSKLEVARAGDPQRTCHDEQKLNSTAAKKVMLEHLRSRYE